MTNCNSKLFSNGNHLIVLNVESYSRDLKYTLSAYLDFESKNLFHFSTTFLPKESHPCSQAAYPPPKTHLQVKKILADNDK
jgi:hypothetical protein